MFVGGESGMEEDLRRTMNLRRERDELRNGAADYSSVSVEDESVFAVVRDAGTAVATLVLVNLSPALSPPPAGWAAAGGWRAMRTTTQGPRDCDPARRDRSTLSWRRTGSLWWSSSGEPHRGDGKLGPIRRARWLDRQAGGRDSDRGGRTVSTVARPEQTGAKSAGQANSAGGRTGIVVRRDYLPRRLRDASAPLPPGSPTASGTSRQSTPSDCASSPPGVTRRRPPTPPSGSRSSPGPARQPSSASARGGPSLPSPLSG